MPSYYRRRRSSRYGRRRTYRKRRPIGRLTRKFQRRPRYLARGNPRRYLKTRPVTGYDSVPNSWPDACLANFQENFSSVLLMNVGDIGNDFYISGNFFQGQPPSGDFTTYAAHYNKMKVVKTTVVADFFMADPSIPSGTLNILKVGLTQLPVGVTSANIGGFTATRQREELPFSVVKSMTTEGGGDYIRCRMTSTPLKAYGDHGITDGTHTVLATNAPSTSPSLGYLFLAWISSGAVGAADDYSVTVQYTVYRTVKFFHRKVPGQT